MAQPKISPKKIKGIISLYSLSNINKSQLSRTFKVSRSTVSDYLTLFSDSDFSFVDALQMSGEKLSHILRNKNSTHSPRQETLLKSFPNLHEQLELGRTSLKDSWSNYKKEIPSGYEYSQFVSLYHKWRTEKGLPKVKFNKWSIDSISEEELRVLRKWKLSPQRRKWERAVAILGLHKGNNITKISRKIERSCRTILKWRHTFLHEGLCQLDTQRTRKVDKSITDNIGLKKERLIKLIHEPPSIHDINRTSWSLQTLAQVYENLYSEKISKSSISEYVRSQGYTFKKARKVLTSQDPDFRKKLNKIISILSNLRSEEKFFSIDEFGPFAVKIRGGRSLTHKDQVKAIPQRQKSKGSIICTAALELSTNQVTHFYSSKKNTVEMIKLLRELLEKYKDENRLFLSWDAASWHVSKDLYKEVEKVNNSGQNTPQIELAPLPSGAQFLNVIESVFSGMARAIIHNSDYQSIEECQKAIDRYFAERNQSFLLNPKKGGNKIWGKEVVKPVFKESNNCKDPKMALKHFSLL